MIGIVILALYLHVIALFFELLAIPLFLGIFQSCWEEFRRIKKHDNI
jgi:hypothetical protein